MSQQGVLAFTCSQPIGGLASRSMGGWGVATLTRSPVMSSEWAGELAGGYSYSLGPLLSRCGGLGHPAFVVLPLLVFAPFPFVVGSRLLAVDVGGHSGAPFLACSRRGVQRCSCSRWLMWVSFIQLGGQWGPAGWGCSPWALLSVFVIIGVLVLVGESGGWWPAVRACDGGIYAHIPRKGRGEVESGWSWA